jgi:hypothetical protein
LAYLQQLPVRRLKIDRSFVSRMLDDEASTAIVRSTIELATELGLDTVAEGVEDDATVQRLREFGCSTVQGFGLAAPMSPEGFERAIWRLEHRGRPLRSGLAPADRGDPTGSVPTQAVASFPAVERVRGTNRDRARAATGTHARVEPAAGPVPPSAPVPVSTAGPGPVPTRRALRLAAQPPPSPAAGAVSGLRAAATSERTTGVDPA